MTKKTHGATWRKKDIDRLCGAIRDFWYFQVPSESWASMEYLRANPLGRR
jgi:hypothetical protein